MAAPLLAVRGLTVAFGAPARPILAVDGIDFEIAAGGVLGLVGESGSGKSMTSLALMRLVPEPPGRVSGRVDFAGTDLLALPRERMPDIRGREIAMIFQEPMSSLNPVMTIGAQIDEALFLHETLSRRERRARVLAALAGVGIPAPAERVDAFPHQFSGGMRQRVMIAMALACDPKLLVADEPTTALDVTVQAQVLDLMRKLQAERGTALLLISHDFGVIAGIAEQVAVMYAGRIVETGAVRDIFRHPAHPYTQALLRAIPRRTADVGRLYQIPGTVPSPLERPPGCAFAPRCSLVIARCREAVPALVSVGAGHEAACLVAGSGA